jgi:hypothetical protein
MPSSMPIDFSQAPGLLEQAEAAIQSSLPTREQFVQYLSGLGIVECILLVLLGLVYLLYGYRYFKAMVIVNAAAIGAIIGAMIGVNMHSRNMPLVLGVVGAIVLALASWPLLKTMVGLLAAAAGWFIGYAAWDVIGRSLSNSEMLASHWAGGLIGAIVLGAMTLIAFTHMVMLFTSLQGASMLFSGVAAVLLTQTDLDESVRRGLLSNQYLILTLVGVPALVGFLFQYLVLHRGKKAATDA